MQHLRRLPLAEVKIDRSFVLGMVNDPDDEAIVRSIIDLAGALGLRVVAEGVEDDRTRRLLLAAGCDVAQGWFYARPMPADDLVGWLSRYRPPQQQLTWPHQAVCSSRLSRRERPSPSRRPGAGCRVRTRGQAGRISGPEGGRMAAISRAEVAHLARLSRLAVTDEELDMFAGQLDVILQSIARIGEVPRPTSRRRRTRCR